eukprot:669273-Pleurochrysis_carterae.AAC.3
MDEQQLANALSLLTQQRGAAQHFVHCIHRHQPASQPLEVLLLPREQAMLRDAQLLEPFRLAHTRAQRLQLTLCRLWLVCLVCLVASLTA